MLKEAIKMQHYLSDNATRTDIENIFPSENIHLLKKAGLMSFLIPKEFGGYGGTVTELVQIARILGAGCLSTAMIWAMHCQQVACIINHASLDFKESFLSKIGQQNHFVGSVTTEKGNSESILSSISPLVIKENGCIEINRVAPIVTGGISCDVYLITMKANESANNTDVKLVYVERDQVDINEVSATIDMLGMRGTNSIALTFRGQVPPVQIINNDSGFEDIAYYTMIPMGHIGWASCWLGAAINAFKQMIGILRSPDNNKRFNLNSDLLLEKIARVRMTLDVVSSFINDVTNEYVELNTTNKVKLRSPGFLIKINNLKVYASEVLFNSMCDLMEIAGVRFGYVKGEHNQLERAFRDLRSAALMINNDKLLISNGKLSLFDKSLG